MKRNYKLCEKCNRKISISNYKIHIHCCNGKLKETIKEEWKICDNKYKCPHCDKIYSKKGIYTHVWRNHGDGINHHLKINYDNRNVWNKGLTKDTDARVFKNTESVKMYYKNNVSAWKGKHHSIETKKLLSIKTGGYRKGSGHGKSGWYKGFWCDSSWELAYVLYNLDNGIEFKRNKKKFKYNFNDEMHKYIPDYYIECDKIYVEIKGYINEKWESKKKQFPKKLKIIGKNEIKPILEYVKSKYGKDFISLYETKVH